MSSEELKSSTLVLVVICLYASFQRWLKDTLVGVGGMGGSSLRSCWLNFTSFIFAKDKANMEGWDPLSVMVPRC